MGMPSPATGGSHRPARHVVLVGLMGSGKTTVGRLVAHALGFPFHDSDEAFARDEGRTAAVIRSADGTHGLHALEAADLRAAIAAPDPSVIAAAASVIDDPGCRRALRGRGVAVAWLRAEPADLARRFAAGPHRPVYGPDPATVFEDQARLRGRRFLAVHPLVTVDTSRGTAQEAASAVLDALSRPGAR